MTATTSQLPAPELLTGSGGADVKRHRDMSLHQLRGSREKFHTLVSSPKRTFLGGDKYERGFSFLHRYIIKGGGARWKEMQQKNAKVGVQF